MAEAVERLLVTGGGGFVGKHLLERLASRGIDWRIFAPGAPGPLLAEPFDITNPGEVLAMVETVRPTKVVHLAAVAAVTHAGDNPRLAWDVNLGGTFNLIEALKRHAPSASLLHVSSGEVYGASLEAGDVDETTLLQPTSAYAATKAAADILVRQECSQGLRACIARPFNHIGPGQSEAFALPAFAAQIARIEAGLAAPVVYVGSLQDERDFLAVDDVVEAYVALLLASGRADQGGVFNVASGSSVPLQAMLDQLIGMARVPVRVEVDPKRLRGRAPYRVRTNARRLREATGWRPTMPLATVLRQLLDYERSRVSNASAEAQVISKT